MWFIRWLFRPITIPVRALFMSFRVARWKNEMERKYAGETNRRVLCTGPDGKTHAFGRLPWSDEPAGEIEFRLGTAQKESGEAAVLDTESPVGWNFREPQPAIGDQ